MNVINHPTSFKASPSSPEGNNEKTTPGTPKRNKHVLNTLLYGTAALVLLAGGVYAGWEYLNVWQYEESTDDAYVQADIVPIAPQVSGYVSSVAVGDNQAVKAGQILATIDQRDYQDAVKQATADVAVATASIASITAQLTEQNAVIQEARATVAADQASDMYAQQNKQRFGTLEKSGSGSLQQSQQAESEAGSTAAVVAKDQAAFDAAQKQIGTLTAQLSEAKATLEHNQAALAQAELSLGYTVLRAPVDGVIGERTIRVGLFAQPGAQLLAVVPVQASYIVANYKETQLAGVRQGQPVRIDVDTFSDTPIRGFVNSVAPASGQEFALLPPDNATGNFTKIVQRVPVKITIDRTDPLAGRLLPGMSVTTTITTNGPSASDPAKSSN